jgi:hypothetical protein
MWLGIGLQLKFHENSIEKMVNCLDSHHNSSPPPINCLKYLIKASDKAQNKYFQQLIGHFQFTFHCCKILEIEKEKELFPRNFDQQNFFSPF